MPTIVDLAVCVRQWDWSETSQTVSLFARQGGLLRAVAKGSKRQDARFSGGLGTLTLGEAVAIVRAGAPLATLTAWDLRESFPALRRSLSAFYAGMYVADLVQHAVVEHDPHPALFDETVNALRALGGPGGARADRLTVLRFQWALLNETGYQPELERDVRSGAELVAAGFYGFSARGGGLTADPQPDGPGVQAGAAVWRVRAQTVAALRALARRATAAELDAVCGGDSLDRANRLLASYIREILGREVPSFAALLGSEPPGAARDLSRQPGG